MFSLPDDDVWCTTESRLNFLELPRAAHNDCVINDAARNFMREHTLTGSVVAGLANLAMPSQPTVPRRLAA